jgi:hypothetical protein
VHGHSCRMDAQGESTCIVHGRSTVRCSPVTHLPSAAFNPPRPFPPRRACRQAEYTSRPRSRNSADVPAIARRDWLLPSGPVASLAPVSAPALSFGSGSTVVSSLIHTRQPVSPSPTLASAISAFGVAAKAKLGNPAVSGEPEDQLRAPLEHLMADLAELCGASGCRLSHGRKW